MSVSTSPYSSITLTVKPKSGKRALRGHPWIFSNEIVHPKPLPVPGSIVTVLDEKQNFLGYAGYNPHSLIALRILSRQPDQIPGTREWFQEKVSRAEQLRKWIYPQRHSYRLLFADSDGVPGLIVDKYETVLAVQILTATMENLMDPLQEALIQLFHPQAIVLQNDTDSRKLEGLPQYTRVLYGTVEEPVLISEYGVNMAVDVRTGQKTGHFFDQADNRQALAPYARDATVLDLFSYTGAWSLHLLQAGAQKSTAVDVSAPALASARRNAELNGVSGRFETIQSDAFTWLSRAREQKLSFDLVVCDPPAFAKNARQVKNALRGYEDIHRQAIHLVRENGVLCACSCSYHIDENAFLQTLQNAASRERKHLRILEIRGQAADHPILLAMPESRYLKCVIGVVNSF
jgi:23S rRNA (cytosine1962-C5)-methyltransferase